MIHALPEICRHRREESALKPEPITRVRVTRDMIGQRVSIHTGSGRTIWRIEFDRAGEPRATKVYGPGIWNAWRPEHVPGMVMDVARTVTGHLGSVGYLPDFSA